MQKLFSIILLCINIGCASSKKTNSANSTFNGTWIPIKQEMGGAELPEAAFKNQRLTLTDSTYIMIAESIDKGTVSIKDGKLEIYGKEGVNKGNHFTAIYKLENGEMTICYNLKGDSYPESFETKGKPLYFLSVFKKE